MRIQLVTELEELEGISDEWNALTLPSPMQSPDWLIPWWHVYGQDRQLSVVSIRGGDGRLLGLCPWYVEARTASTSLRWLGDGAVCSDHASIITAPGAEQAVLQAASEWLQENGDRHGHVTLESIDAANSVMAQFGKQMQDGGWILSARSEPGTSCIELPDSWDEYLAAVSKNHRKRCRKWLRDLFDSREARVEVVSAPEDCLEHYERLVLLHNGRRQAAGKRGAFENHQFRVFHRLALRRLAESGRAQLRLLWVKRSLAAMEYVLVDDEAVYAYQSGMSAEGEAISAGNLSVLAIVRDALTAGKRRVDLLRGTEPYKFSWGAVHRPAATLRLRPRSLTGVVHSYVDAVVERARDVRRTLIDSST